MDLYCEMIDSLNESTELNRYIYSINTLILQEASDESAFTKIKNRFIEFCKRIRKAIKEFIDKIFKKGEEKTKEVQVNIVKQEVKKVENNKEIPKEKKAETAKKVLHYLTADKEEANNKGFDAVMSTGKDSVMFKILINSNGSGFKMTYDTDIDEYVKRINEFIQGADNISNKISNNISEKDIEDIKAFVQKYNDNVLAFATNSKDEEYAFDEVYTQEFLHKLSQLQFQYTDAKNKYKKVFDSINGTIAKAEINISKIKPDELKISYQNFSILCTEFMNVIKDAYRYSKIHVFAITSELGTISNMIRQIGNSATKMTNSNKVSED